MAKRAKKAAPKAKKSVSKAKVVRARKSKSKGAKRKVKPIPDNYPPIGVALRVKGGADALAFYGRVFGGRERLRLDMPDGRIGHAEMKIGDGLIMLSDEFPEMNILGPKTIGGASVTIQIYVRDADAVLERAVAAGAIVLRPIHDEFYGDRSVTVEDPFGHVWMIQTHIENVSPREMQRRLEKMTAAG